jgi:nucleotidyltransferase substrate binding protein (TIGR01987 family)
MNVVRLKEMIEESPKAVLRLKEALDEDLSNPLVYDGVIQRFELTYELAWKLIKAYLEYDGIASVNTPRSAFIEAFAAGLILDGDTWIDMIADRSLTVHTYNEQMAKDIYCMIKQKYYTSFAALTDKAAGVFK